MMDHRWWHFQMEIIYLMSQLHTSPTDWVSTIQFHVKMIDLISWMACQCIALFSLMIMPHFNMVDTEVYWTRRSLWVKVEQWIGLHVEFKLTFKLNTPHSLNRNIILPLKTSRKTMYLSMLFQWIECIISKRNSCLSHITTPNNNKHSAQCFAVSVLLTN